MHFPRHPFSDARRRTTGNGHGVDVTQHGEGNRLTVRRDVHVHPCAFIGLDCDLPDVRALWRFDIPFAVSFFSRFFACSFRFLRNKRTGDDRSPNQKRGGESASFGEMTAHL